MSIEVAGGLVGSALGSALAPKGKKEDPAATINNLLGKALNRAVTTNNQYSGQAINQQNTSLQQAIAALTQGTQKASDVATSTMAGGLNAYKTAQQPYATAGYDALDAYKQSLGLSTPVGGSAQAVQNQEMATSMAPQLQSLLGSLKGNYSAGTAPTAFTAQAALTPEQQAQAQQAALHNYYTANPTGNNNAANMAESQKMLEYLKTGKVPTYQAGMNGSKTYNMNVSGIDQAYKTQQQQQLAQINQAGQSAYQNQLNQYNQQSGTINQVNQMLAGMTPQQMQALAPLLKGKI